MKHALPKRQNTRTICITPLQSMLVEGLQPRQCVLVRLTNLTLSSNRKTHQRRKLQTNNKRSKLILGAYFTGMKHALPKRQNTRTICITPLQSILEEGLQLRQSVLVRLTNQFDAFFNPKNASETKAADK